MSEKSVSSVVKFKYEKAPEYRTFMANAVWGGLDVYGNIVFDLIEERKVVPPSMNLTIYDDGTQKEEWIADRDDFVRIRQAGVSIPVGTAESIIKWLQEKVDLYKKNNQGE